MISYSGCIIGEAQDNFGISLAGLGDMNGDGNADFVVGAHHANPGGENSGRASVFSGIDGTELWSLPGPAAYDEFGISVANVGDLNDDGFDDVAVGAHLHDYSGENAGAVFIYLLGDADGDGYNYPCDNCPQVTNFVQEDSDADGVGDSCDNCQSMFNPDQADADGDGIGDVCDYVCGDADGNTVVNITDAVALIQYIFNGGPAPEPLLAGDANCDLATNITDAVYLINYIFNSGPVPCAACAK
ncbi:MAG: dockerin type I domain-containing protein [bacterium]